MLHLFIYSSVVQFFFPYVRKSDAAEQNLMYVQVKKTRLTAVVLSAGGLKCS